jgi:hypothetical protein
MNEVDYEFINTHPMKGQLFGFMKELVPLIISGRKYLTNRVATPFRQRLIIGGKMTIATGIRTPNYKRIGTAIVLEKKYWWPKHMPHPDALGSSIKNVAPLDDMTWAHFAWVDGFAYYDQFYNYFMKHKGPADKYGFVCYKFKFSIERD